MKKLLYSISIALSIMTIACKKDKDVSILGYWTGTLTQTGASSIFLGILYNSDGTVRGYSNNSDTTIASKGNGTYSIDADSIRMIFVSNVGVPISAFAGKLNSSSNQMNGTFRVFTSSENGIYTISK